MVAGVDAAGGGCEGAEIAYQGKRRVVPVPAHLEEEPPLRGLGPLESGAGAEGEPTQVSPLRATMKPSRSGRDDSSVGGLEENSLLDELFRNGPEDRAVEAETVVEVPEPEDADHVMLIRPRKSRIYYLRKFFDYPITLTGNTVKNLGLVRMAKVGVSYIGTKFHKI